MSEQTVEQKLQSEIVILKSRILDTQDHAQRVKADCDLLTKVLGEIAAVVGVTGDSVKIEDLVEAVKALVPEASDEEYSEEE
ncbi:tail fiber assembly protein [Phage NC-G]|nr:tail fiber assembly protein [Phage NC-G]QPI13346.1 tail fiber assembly protein [Salmonella phage vB_SalM_ABTNLsp5]